MTTMQIDRAALTVLDGIINTGGITLSVSTLHRPDWGFMVATAGREERVNALSIDNVNAYIQKHRAILATTGHYVGGWSYNGETFLDVSVWLSDRDKAIALAKSNKQIALYDISNELEVFV